MNIATARLSFLAHSVLITQLAVPGCPSRKVNLQGIVVTQNCIPSEGLSVIFNSEPGNSFATLGGIRQYSDRWFHGMPSELCQEVTPRQTRPTIHCEALLNRFAQTLNRNECVIRVQNPLMVRSLFARGMGLLPKGKLRIKANQKVANKRRRQGSVGATSRPKDGVVYFIQDAVTLAIKIGFCLKNPKRRLAALQIGNANTLRFLGYVPGSESHEKCLHRQFSQFHLQGEWFSNGIIAELNGILKCPSLKEWVEVREPSAPPQREATTVERVAAPDGT